MRSVLLLAVIVAAAATAQTPSQPSTSEQSATAGCPIEILGVNPQYGSQSDKANSKTQFEIRYRNVSGKDIKASKFGALFFNALDEPIYSYAQYIDSELLKANVKANDKRVSVGLWYQFNDTAEIADAYVIKVKFADGTFWEDNGSFRCNAGIPELNIAKGGGLKAHEAAIKELERKTLKD
jgi:hypothetical protein